MRTIAWFKVDDNFYDHPKVDELNLEAIGLWTVSGTYAARHLTDGYIPLRRVKRLGGDADIAAELVDAGLWDTADGGYVFRNWEEYQPTKNGVETQREAARTRKQKQRRNKNGEFTVSQNSHSVTPAGQARDGRVTPRDSHKTGENEPLEAGVTPLDVISEFSDLGSVETETQKQKPHDPAENTSMSQRDNPVTHAGLTEESHRESHRPDPTRPDPTTNTLSSDASGASGRSEPKPETVFSDDVHGLANYLATWITDNGNRKPNVTKTWLQAIDRLIRIDGYSPNEIGQVIDWSQRDEFWQGNILSAGKLRKQFDQLKNRMFRDQNRNNGPAGMAPGSQRALNTLQLGQALQAAHDNERSELT